MKHNLAELTIPDRMLGIGVTRLGIAAEHKNCISIGAASNHIENKDQIQMTR